MVATMLEPGRELFDISDGNGLSTAIVSQQIFDNNLET
jgi:hypothetical protein